MTAVSSLSAITSNYSHLNGVGGTYYGDYGYGLGGYGYGLLYNKGNAEQVKERIADNYDINATRMGYNSKQGVETINYNQQCNIIAEELKNGETDQVSERFKEMVNTMKNSPQYANYSDSEICALIRDQYATATGSDLVSDINKKASNPFIQGIKRGIPILGVMFANKNSSADLISQVTNNDQSRSEKTTRVLGTTVGAATGASAVAGLLYAARKTDAAGKIGGLISKLGAKGKLAALAVAGVAGLALITSALKSFASPKKTTNS